MFTTNSSASVALRALATTHRELDAVQRRVSTGLKVASPLDDASNFAIAQGVRGVIKAWGAVTQGLRAGAGAVKVALAGTTAISDALGEVRKKLVEYATADAAGKLVIGADIARYLKQVDGFATNAVFNSVGLIGADSSTSSTPSPIQIASFVFEGPGSAEYTLGTSPGKVKLDFSAVGTGGGQLRLIYGGSTVAVAVNPQNTTGSLSFDYPATGPTTVTVEKTGSPNVNLDLELTFTPDESEPVGDYRVLQNLQGDTIDVQFRSLRLDDIGLDGFDPGNLAQALAKLDAATLEVNQALGYYGSKSQAFTLAIDAAVRFADAHREGLGHMVDADLGRDAAKLRALEIQEMLAVETAAIASARPRALLALFRPQDDEEASRGLIIDVTDEAATSDALPLSHRGTILDTTA